MSAGAALIWCPFPDEASARQAVGALLEERLIACGNIIPGIRSLFSWQGERGDSGECGVLFKTTAAQLEAAMARLEALHPYDTPAILGMPADATPATLDWLTAET